MPKVLAALVALVTGAALSACGTSTAQNTQPRADVTPSSATSSSTSPGPSGSPSDEAPVPATGARLTSSSFTLRLPRHWFDGTGDAPAGVVVMGTHPGDDIVEQIIVQRGAGARAAASLRADGATDVRPSPSVRIDGRAADHARGVGGTRAARTAVDRYTVAAGGTTWQITFSLNRWAHRADRERLIASVLASWSWR